MRRVGLAPIVFLVKSSSTNRASSVLSQVVERFDFRQRLREYSVWNVWAEVVGEVLASKAEPLRIEDGRLFVGVASSTWMQELQFLKDELRTRLNQRLGAFIVRDLYLVLGGPRRRRPKAPAAKLHPVDETEIASLVPDIGHPELEAALRSVARARARRIGPETS